MLQVSRIWAGSCKLFLRACSPRLHPVVAGWYTSAVRRQRHQRPLRPHITILLTGLVLAAVGSLALATLAPPRSSGALGSAQGAVREVFDGPPDDRSSAVSPVPALGTAVSPALAPAPITAVAGPSMDLESIGQQDGRAIRLLPASRVELPGYQWPLPRGRIALPFGPRRDGSRIVDGKPFHDGLDLATFCGDRIVAAHGGVVVAAGRHYDSQMGWIGDLAPYFDRLDARSLWVTLPIVVVIDDGNSYRSIYAHFGRIVVGRGQTVLAGQLLGYEGQTGNASGCHLHYGLFSPEASGRFGIDPAIVEHLKLPAWEIARVDPLLVLPSRPSSSPPPGVTPD